MNVKEWIDEIIDLCEKLNDVPKYNDKIMVFDPIFRGRELHVVGIEKVSEILGVECTRTDWSGNKNCGTNWDEVSALYRGYKLFELKNKEENTNEGK